MLDHNPLSIREFKGLHVSDIDTNFTKYSQGDIPFANSLDCLNLEFMKKGGLRTRNGIDTYEGTYASTTVIGKPMQVFRVHNLLGVPQTDRYLILTWDGTTGRVYDNQVAGPATNPILALTGMKYAYVVNVFGRIYLTPWKAWASPNDVSGTHGWVQVYTGAYNARTAGGSEPTVGTFAAVIAAGGSMTNGVHYISVFFETDTGCFGVIPSAHVTVPLSVTAGAGNNTANLTNIPIGPTGTVARHIVMSKVVVAAFNGFQNDEPFIATTIADNTTTTASLQMPDSALVESAKNRLGIGAGHGGDIIRACVSMSVYNNRMIWNGLRPSTSGTFRSDQHCVLISPINNPEQVGHIEGAVSKLFIGIEYAGKVMNGAELNSRYFIFKEDSTFYVDESQEDPESDPNEWQVKVADPAKGAYPFGIAGSGDNSGNSVAGAPLIINSNYGALLVVGNHGLSIFNGTFSDIPLSEYDLEDTSIDDLKWSQLLIDGVRKVLFWHMGDPDASSDTFLRFGNFKYGLQLGRIRWGTWSFPSNGGITPIWIGLRPPGTVGTVGATTDFDTLYPLLSLLTRSGGPTNWNLKILSETNRVNDYARSTSGYWIPWIYETGYTPNNYGEQYTFSKIYLRALLYWIAGGNGGDASILAQFGILDENTLTTIGTFAPGATPKQYFSLPMTSSIHEKIRIKLSGTNRVFIQNLTLAITERAKDRAR